VYTLVKEELSSLPTDGDVKEDSHAEMLMWLMLTGGLLCWSECSHTQHWCDHYCISCTRLDIYTWHFCCCSPWWADR